MNVAPELSLSRMQPLLPPAAAPTTAAAAAVAAAAATAAAADEGVGVTKVVGVGVTI